MDDVDVPVVIRKLKKNMLDNSKGKYIVAEFLPFKNIDSMTVEAIPGYWLHELSSPFVCPIKKNGKVDKIVQTYICAFIPENQAQHLMRKLKMENSLPDTNTWQQWPINIVLDAIFDTYLDARKEEVKAESYPYSDLQDYVVQSMDKRRIKVNKKKWPDDISSQDETENTDNEDTSRNKRGAMVVQKQISKKKTLDESRIPSPPTYIPEHTTNDNQPNKLLDTMLLAAEDAIITHPPEIVFKETQTPVEIVDNSIPYHNLDEDEYFMHPLEDSLDALSGVPVGATIDLENSDLLETLKEGRNPSEFYKACFLRLLNQNIENRNNIAKLGTLLEEIKLTLNTYCERSVTNNQEKWDAVKHLIALPVDTIEELKLLNATLKENKTYFSYLRQFMMDCCPIPILPNQDSKTIKQELHKVVGHIYCRILTNNLAVGFNMCGRNIHPNRDPNIPKKEGFKKYEEILAVTFEAVKPKAQLSNLQLDRKQTDSAVGEWLRQTRNRMEESKRLKRDKIAAKRAAGLTLTDD